MNTPHLVGRNALSTSSLEGHREEEPARKVEMVYTCADGHVTRVPLWEHAEVPDTWKCRVCSRFAAHGGVDDAETGMWRPPSVAYWEPKTHLEQLHERRTTHELEALLEERLQWLRARRGELGRAED